jgi:hypothetical protein
VLDLLLAAALTAGGYDGGRLLCSFRGPDITESSGLVASSAYDDLLYTHNDSGDVGRLFQLDRTCRNRAVLVLRGVQARDWEDMSRGPGKTLWLGDIGDNSATRDRGLLVHRIEDPGPAEGAVQVRSTAFRLAYEDGPQDAEALLVHPRTGQLLIVTKGFAGGGVYAAPLPLLAGIPNTLRRVGEVRIPEVTAGDISPDGTRVVLRNYSSAYEWDVRGDDVVAALGGEPVRIALPRSTQGEAISYSGDGRSLIVSSEGSGAPVQELRRAAAATPTAGPGAAKPPPPAEPDGDGDDSTVLLLAAGALMAVLAFGLRRTRRRRAR